MTTIVKDDRKMTDPKSQPSAVVAHVKAEVRLLRKGRGIQAGDFEQRLGPLLSELAAGADMPQSAVRRHALIAEISNCGKTLATDVRMAIQASLGLSEQTRQMMHFKDRVSWLATEIGFEYRTALRRIDDAERLLSEEIARELLRRRGRSAIAPDGWHLDELRTLVRLDTATPEVHEHRRIVVTRSGLTEVMAWLDLPQAPGHPGPGLTGEVLYGGRLLRREHPSGTRFQFVVQLPRPLAEGEEHEYGLMLKIPEGQLLPYLIISPECQVNVFDLRVRFGPERRPDWIRRVDGETVRMFDAALPGDDLLDLDEAGEVSAHFDKPTMYLCYGLRWQAGS